MRSGERRKERRRRVLIYFSVLSSLDTCLVIFYLSYVCKWDEDDGMEEDRDLGKEEKDFALTSFILIFCKQCFAVLHQAVWTERMKEWKREWFEFETWEGLLPLFWVIIMMRRRMQKMENRKERKRIRGTQRRKEKRSKTCKETLLLLFFLGSFKSHEGLQHCYCDTGR